MEPEKSPSPLKQIRTFQGDVAEALKRQEESLVSIQQAELARRQAGGRVMEQASSATNATKRKLLLLAGTIGLLALGAGGVWYTYFQYLEQTAVPIVTTPENRFFSVDTEENLSVASTTRLDFINIVSTAQSSVVPGETKHFELNLATAEFFKILETRAPGSLVRAFEPEFMFGSYGQSNFLVLKLSSFENAFAGMLNWEENLASDIGPLFSTAQLLRESTTTPVFIDVTDRNKDSRLLIANGQNILLYSFFENNILIITDNIETLRVLVERLTREKLSR